MHSGSPAGLRRHSGVVRVRQFVHSMGWSGLLLSSAEKDDDEVDDEVDVEGALAVTVVVVVVVAVVGDGMDEVRSVLTGRALNEDVLFVELGAEEAAGKSWPGLDAIRPIDFAPSFGRLCCRNVDALVCEAVRASLLRRGTRISLDPTSYDICTGLGKDWRLVLLAGDKGTKQFVGDIAGVEFPDSSCSSPNSNFARPKLGLNWYC